MLGGYKILGGVRQSLKWYQLDRQPVMYLLHNKQMTETELNWYSQVITRKYLKACPL